MNKSLTEGVKHDGGKVRFELLPPELLEGVADILTFGAQKYTIEYEEEWDRLLDVPNVTEIKITTHEGYVVHVMKNNYDNLTLSMPNDNEKTVGIGRNAIQTRLRGTPNVGRIVQNLVKEIGEQNGWVILGNSVSPNRYTPTSLPKDAKYVDQKDILTLTIVTTQEIFEVYFVQDVTMGSDFWETMWKDLKEHLNISRPLNRTGERNWELGMRWSRVFGALMRHLWAWWNPLVPDTDPETGRSHLWHAGCCLAFLIAYEARNVGEDDRPKK